MSVLKVKAFYRRNLPHLQKFAGTYFVTFRAKENLLLSPAARSIALQHCLFGNGKRYELHAAVIMPTHAHLLFTPSENDQAEPFSLAQIMKGIKGVSARNINQLLHRRGSLWQDESFDRVMRVQEFELRFNYIVANPVEAGLCSKPEEYRWLWLQPAQTGVSVPHKSE